LWRWPIIAAEDVLTGVKLLPQLRVNPLGVVAATTRFPKNKDAWGLSLVMKADPILAGRDSWVDRAAFEKALTAGDAVLTARVAWWLWNSGRYRDDVIALLSRRPGVREVLQRAYRLNDDVQTRFMLAAATLCALDQVAGDEQGVDELPRIDPSDISPVGKTVCWYACDAHTAPGGIAIRTVAKQALIPVAQLAATWFWLESATLGGAVAAHRYYTVDASLIDDGVDPKAARRGWLELRTDATRTVAWACSRYGITAV
jgi:hypothetical protein